MMYWSQLISQLLKQVILVWLVVMVFNPGIAGRWRAAYDIGLDRAWQEYVGDCDCTPDLDQDPAAW